MTQSSINVFVSFYFFIARFLISYSSIVILISDFFRSGGSVEAFCRIPAKPSECGGAAWAI